MIWISKDIKKKILNSVKNEWIAVSKLSEEYWVSTVTIYTWMRKEWEQNKSSTVNLWELNRLKKDKQDLLLIIWELTAEINKAKKKSLK
jgi:hypothetical protein